MLLTFPAKHCLNLNLISSFLNFYLSTKFCNCFNKCLHSFDFIRIHLFIITEFFLNTVKYTLKAFIKLLQFINAFTLFMHIIFKYIMIKLCIRKYLILSLIKNYNLIKNILLLLKTVYHNLKIISSHACLLLIH